MLEGKSNNILEDKSSNLQYFYKAENKRYFKKIIYWMKSTWNILFKALMMSNSKQLVRDWGLELSNKKLKYNQRRRQQKNLKHSFVIIPMYIRLCLYIFIIFLLIYIYGDMSPYHSFNYYNFIICSNV